MLVLYLHCRSLLWLFSETTPCLDEEKMASEVSPRGDSSLISGNDVPLCLNLDGEACRSKPFKTFI